MSVCWSYESKSVGKNEFSLKADSSEGLRVCYEE